MSFWQNKTLSLHNLISSWFTLIVCMGYITVQTGIYQAVHGTVCKFPYEPYVLEFLFYLIFMWPFRNFRSKSIVIDSVPFLNGRLRSILKVLLFSYSFYFLLMVKVAIYVFGQGVGEAYDATHFEGTTLYQYSNFESKILWICGSLYDWTSPIIIIYALYGIISKRNGWTFKFNSFCILYILGIYFLIVFLQDKEVVYSFFLFVCYLYLFLFGHRYQRRQNAISFHLLLMLYYCF